MTSSGELLQQGIDLLKAGNVPGALAVLTQIIDSATAGPDAKAEALYQRSIGKLMVQDKEGAAADWVAIQYLPGIPKETADRMRAETAKLFSWSIQHEAESAPTKNEIQAGIVEQHMPVLEKPDANPFEKWFSASIIVKYADVPQDIRARARALVDANRPPFAKSISKNLFEGGIHFMNEKLPPMAIIMFEELCRPDRGVSKFTAQGLNHLGFARMQWDDFEGAKCEWEKVLRLPGAPKNEIHTAEVCLARINAKARMEEAEEKLRTGDREGAIAAWQAVLDAPDGHEFDKFTAANQLQRMGNLPPELETKVQEHIALLRQTKQAQPTPTTQPFWKRILPWRRREQK